MKDEMPADVSEKLNELPEKLKGLISYRNKQVRVDGESHWERKDGLIPDIGSRYFERDNATGLFNWDKIISYAEQVAVCKDRNAKEQEQGKQFWRN